jgi:hypothetical protein
MGYHVLGGKNANQCKNPTLTPIYGAFGLEYYIIISPLVVFESMV